MVKSCAGTHDYFQGGKKVESLGGDGSGTHAEEGAYSSSMAREEGLSGLRRVEERVEESEVSPNAGEGKLEGWNPVD